MATEADVLTRARSTLNEKESPPGSNRIRFWSEIGRGELQGQPWCGAWVTWVMKPFFPAINFVYCPAGRNDFANRHRLFGTPQIGDVVFYEWETDVLVDHTGIVEEVHPGYIVAIEGNTQTGAAGNQSDGGGVFRRQRTINLCHGFGRPDYPLTLPTSKEAHAMLAPGESAIAIEATPTGLGYYVCSDGGAIYAYGDAHYEGGGNQYQHVRPFTDMSPIVGGYFLLMADGGVEAFGKAKYLGGPNT